MKRETDDRFNIMRDRIQIQEENKRIQRDNERKNPEDAAEKFKTRYRMKD